MRQDLIVIKPHDPAWAEQFAAQKNVLEAALRTWLACPIEHIGSTSVPGLPAKPIIDMLAVIDGYLAFGSAAPGLRHIGWVVAPEPGDEERRRWSLCFPNEEHRTHHLHVVEHSSIGWRDWLLFRDYLRTNAQAAERYAALKRELADADDADRARYRSGKAPLIAELMQEARRWRSDRQT